MKKALWAMVPILSFGTLAWLPFVVLRDHMKTWLFVTSTFAMVAAAVSTPDNTGWSALAGFYIVCHVAAASTLAAMGFYEREKLARQWSGEPWKPSK